MSEPAVFVRQIPVLAADSVFTPLGGGNVNRAWRVSSGGREFVLRADTDIALTLGLDRAREVAVLESLTATGFAPEVVYADPDQGLLLTEFVPGHVCDIAGLSAPARVRQLAAILGQLWRINSALPPLDYAAAAARYAQALGTAAAARMAAEAAELAGKWCSERDRFVLCHNDLAPSNVVVTGEGGLCLIDWEYAAPGEPCFELAVLGASAGPQAKLLQALEGAGWQLEPARMAGCRLLYQRLSALWLMVVCEDSQAPAVYRQALGNVLESLEPC